jgi:hypothetical protein
VIQRVGAGIAALIFALIAGGSLRLADAAAPSPNPDLAVCASSGGSGTAWSRLAAHLPPSCAQSQAAPHLFVLAVGATLAERSSRAAEPAPANLDLAAVSGQNFTLVASGEPSPVPARCRLTVSPNPGALVLPNPRNGVVLLVCRNQPRP